MELSIAVLLKLVVDELVIVDGEVVSYIEVDLLISMTMYEAMEILLKNDEDQVLRNDFEMNMMNVVQQVEVLLLMMVDYFVVVSVQH